MGSSEGLQLVGRGVVPGVPGRSLRGIPGPDFPTTLGADERRGVRMGSHAGAAPVRFPLVRRFASHDRRGGPRIRIRRQAAERRRRERREARGQPPAEAAGEKARGSHQGVGRQATARQGLRAGGGEPDPGDDERTPHHHGRGDRRVLQVRGSEPGAQAPPAARRPRRRRRGRPGVQRADSRARTRGTAPRGAPFTGRVGERPGPAGQQDRRGTQRNHLRRRSREVAQVRRAAQDGVVQGRDGNRVVPPEGGADTDATHRPGRVRRQRRRGPREGVQKQGFKLEGAHRGRQRTRRRRVRRGSRLERSRQGSRPLRGSLVRHRGATRDGRLPAPPVKAVAGVVQHRDTGVPARGTAGLGQGAHRAHA
mmetsp:Transcript_8734/g.24383  ORF Transcript_8734/g.24383 Transcript_8734/m.24383 type:complete len:366 (+) Transcript_8734:427-1524(+)